MKHIPIVIISDKKLAFAAATTFVNLLETKKPETFYDLYAIVSPTFGKRNEEKLKSIEKQYAGCKITIIHGDNRFDKIHNSTQYISNACAYKFCLAEFLPQCDKVIYLDTDINVFDDLTSLYEIDIKDNYIGGVFSLWHYLDPKADIHEIVPLPDFLHYVNAGVLVFNLKSIREHKVIPQCMKLIGTFKGSVDQHIYNKVCYGHIALVPPKYNVTNTNAPFYESDEGKIAFTNKELMETKNPVIYHHTGRRKPWNYVGAPYGAIWLRYYKKSPYGNIPLELEDIKPQKTVPQISPVPPVPQPIPDVITGNRVFKKVTKGNGRVHIHFFGLKIASYNGRRKK